MNKYIKKVMIFVLVIVLVAATALVGCGKDKNKDNNGGEKNPAGSTEKPSDSVAQKEELTLEMAQKDPVEFFAVAMKNTVSAENAKDWFSDDYSMQIKLEPTEEEYAGEYIDFILYGAKNGDNAFAIDINADGVKAAADAWFTADGATVSSDDLGVNATVTKEYVDTLIDTLISNKILGGEDTENKLPDLSEIKTKIDDLKEKFEKSIKDIVTGEDGFKAEEIEIDVNGEKVPAVKLSYSLDKYALDKLISSLLDEYSDDIEELLEFIGQFAGGSSYEYYDEETGEWVTESYEPEIPTATDVKKFISAMISQMDVVDYSIDIIVNDKTDCIDSTVEKLVVKCENAFNIDLTSTTTDFANPAGPKMVVDIKADDGADPTTVKIVKESNIKDDVFTVVLYADATVNGETQRVFDLTGTYNAKTKAYKYEAKGGMLSVINKVAPMSVKDADTLEEDNTEFSVVLEGTIEVTENSYKMTVDKWLMNEESAETKILIEIKSGVTMPAVPADATKIDSDDALESYVSGLDMEKIQSVLEGFGFGAQEYPDYDDEYYDEDYDVVYNENV